MNVITTDQSLSFQTLANLLKKQCIKDFLLFLKWRKYYLNDSWDLEATDQQYKNISVMDNNNKIRQGLYACGAF